MKLRPTGAFLGTLLLLASCESGKSPVAPEGTVLTISADPAAISITGTATIRVVAFDGERGTPVRRGTEIRFAATLGSIDEVAITDSDGVALATLRADGRAGTATVTASSGLGAGSDGKASATVTVTIGASGLTAKFAFEVDGSTVVFRDQSTGDVRSWEWDFGDGVTSAERNPVHTYRVPGDYKVKLTVSNANGSDSITDLVVIGEAPKADFTFTASGRTVIFTDTSSGEPLRWRWRFGDRKSSRRQNPVHTYAEDGTYVVELQVRNRTGESTVAKFVTVP